MIKTFMELDERLLTILTAYLHLAKKKETFFNNTTLENMTIERVRRELTENPLLNRKYFKELIK